MSRLRIFSQEAPSSSRVDTTDGAEIARHLDTAGIRFERWRAGIDLAPNADQDAVLGAYRRDVDRLMTQRGYQSADVVRMQPDHPQKDQLRAKFLDEHTHAEDETRFFVEGSGVFYLHVGDLVHAVLCERGDLISVPASTMHWFDMGPRPRFAAIRLFTNPDGWVARFTGSDIAQRFPKFGE
ncbi:MAG: acireductone dioxygenase [Myxococcota bacterium]|nr:acireductone dioxygenase [Myxococcota bacterium]